MLNLFVVMVGGGAGSACRYLFSLIALRWFGNDFSWGTLGVNLIGCLLIGFLYGLVEKNLLSSSTRLFLTTGFVGGLTTFSTFAWETSGFFREGQFFLGLLNLAANNLGGLALVISGIWLGRLI